VKYLLDNDASSLVLRGHPTLGNRVTNTPYEDLYISGIAVEEMLIGALAALNRARSDRSVSLRDAYARLARIIQHLARFNILPYDDAAESLYQSWPAHVRRVGKFDCRTAALAITHHLVVVTCNGKDFSRIPEVAFEDWAE
jgi:tRNA(fMet)-specific endonuclease VapC